MLRLFVCLVACCLLVLALCTACLWEPLAPEPIAPSASHIHIDEPQQPEPIPPAKPPGEPYVYTTPEEEPISDLPDMGIRPPLPKYEEGPAAAALPYDASSYLVWEELSFAGVPLFITEGELIDHMGSDYMTQSGMHVWGAREYYYPGVDFGVDQYHANEESTSYYEKDGVHYINYVSTIYVYVRSNLPSPRGIRVGDSFEDVMAKFPQEKNYLEDEYGCFYGEYVYLSDFGRVYGNYGRVLEQDGRREIWIATAEMPFMKLYFDHQNNLCSYYIFALGC